MLHVKGAARQKVKLDTKLFSHTTASAFIRCAQLGMCRDSESFILSSELIQIINDWFDIFNSKTSHKDSRPLSKAYGLSLSQQNEVLKSMNEIVVKFFPVRKNANLLPFQRGILQNNNGLPQLLTHVQEQYNMSYILSSKLNQDCLENFFSSIRSKGGLHDHPSPLELKYRLRSYLLGRNEHILGSQTNVATSNEQLIEFNNILSLNINEKINENPPSEEEKIELAEQHEVENLWGEMNSLNDVEYDGFENFAGYIISKMGLKELGFRTHENKDENFAFVNVLSEGGLNKPNNDFLTKLENLNSIFVQICGDYLYTGPNFMKKLLCYSNLV